MSSHKVSISYWSCGCRPSDSHFCPFPANCSDLAMIAYSGSDCQENNFIALYDYSKDANTCKDYDTVGLLYASVRLLCSVGSSIPVPTSSVVTK